MKQEYGRSPNLSMKKALGQFHLAGMVSANLGTNSMPQHIATRKLLEPVGTSMDFWPSTESHLTHLKTKNIYLLEMRMDMAVTLPAPSVVQSWAMLATEALRLELLEAAHRMLAWPYTRFVGLFLEASVQELIY